MQRLRAAPGPENKWWLWNSTLNKTFIPPPLRLKEYWERWGRKCIKSWKTRWKAMKCHPLDWIQPLHELITTCDYLPWQSHKTGPVNSQSIAGREAYEALSLQLKFCLPIDAGSGVATAEPTRLQWVASNPWIRRRPLLVTMCHKTKLVHTNAREICGEEWGVFGW